VPGEDGVPVPWVSFHPFRQTRASLLFDAGRNVKQVAEWLGHADPAFTLRTLVHLMGEALGDADYSMIWSARSRSRAQRTNGDRDR
jgi:integrase